MADNFDDNFGITPEEAFEADSNLRGFIAQAAELYDALKTLLSDIDQEYTANGKRTSLLVLMRKDIVKLTGFLSVLCHARNNLPVWMLDGMCFSDGVKNTAVEIAAAIDQLDLVELMETRTLTKDTEVTLNKFTSEVCGVLTALRRFNGADQNISMIYYLYGTLLTTVCQVISRNGDTVQFLVGQNNYLRRQFVEIGEHITGSAEVQFESSLIPYLKQVNAQMSQELLEAQS